MPSPRQRDEDAEFERLSSSNESRVLPGCRGNADTSGRATCILHCAPDNYLLETLAGLPRHAIGATDTRHFDAIAATRLVMRNALAQ